MSVSWEYALKKVVPPPPLLPRRAATRVRADAHLWALAAPPKTKRTLDQEKASADEEEKQKAAAAEEDVEEEEEEEEDSSEEDDDGLGPLGAREFTTLHPEIQAAEAAAATPALLEEKAPQSRRLGSPEQLGLPVLLPRQDRSRASYPVDPILEVQEQRIGTVYCEYNGQVYREVILAPEAKIPFGTARLESSPVQDLGMALLTPSSTLSSVPPSSGSSGGLVSADQPATAENLNGPQSVDDFLPQQEMLDRLTLNLDLPGGNHFRLRVEGLRFRPSPTALAPVSLITGDPSLTARILPAPGSDSVTRSSTLTACGGITGVDLSQLPGGSHIQAFLRLLRSPHFTVGSSKWKFEFDRPWMKETPLEEISGNPLSLSPYTWVMCDRCLVWKPLGENSEHPPPTPWYCEYNSDLSQADCHNPLLQQHQQFQVTLDSMITSSSTSTHAPAASSSVSSPNINSSSGHSRRSGHPDAFLIVQPLCRSDFRNLRFGERYCAVCLGRGGNVSYFDSNPGSRQFLGSGFTATAAGESVVAQQKRREFQARQELVDRQVLITCAGPCLRSFHTGCVQLQRLDPLESWFCHQCLSGVHRCSVCGEVGKLGLDLVKCSLRCGQMYHPGCFWKALDKLSGSFKHACQGETMPEPSACSSSSADSSCCPSSDTATQASHSSCNRTPRLPLVREPPMKQEHGEQHRPSTATAVDGSVMNSTGRRQQSWKGQKRKSVVTNDPQQAFGVLDPQTHREQLESGQTLQPTPAVENWAPKPCPMHWCASCGFSGRPPLGEGCGNREEQGFSDGLGEPGSPTASEVSTNSSSSSNQYSVGEDKTNSSSSSNRNTRRTAADKSDTSASGGGKAGVRAGGDGPFQTLRTKPGRYGLSRFLQEQSLPNTLLRCVLCPRAFHRNEVCCPGTWLSEGRWISDTDFLCPRHTLQELEGRKLLNPQHQTDYTPTLDLHHSTGRSGQNSPPADPAQIETLRKNARRAWRRHPAELRFVLTQCTPVEMDWEQRQNLLEAATQNVGHPDFVDELGTAGGPSYSQRHVLFGSALNTKDIIAPDGRHVILRDEELEQLLRQSDKTERFESISRKRDLSARVDLSRELRGIIQQHALQLSLGFRKAARRLQEELRAVLQRHLQLHQRAIPSPSEGTAGEDAGGTGGTSGGRPVNRESEDDPYHDLEMIIRKARAMRAEQRQETAAASTSDGMQDDSGQESSDGDSGDEDGDDDDDEEEEEEEEGEEGSIEPAENGGWSDLQQFILTREILPFVPAPKPRAVRGQELPVLESRIGTQASSRAAAANMKKHLKRLSDESRAAQELGVLPHGLGEAERHSRRIRSAAREADFRRDPFYRRSLQGDGDLELSEESSDEDCGRKHEILSGRAGRRRRRQSGGRRRPPSGSRESDSLDLEGVETARSTRQTARERRKRARQTRRSRSSAESDPEDGGDEDEEADDQGRNRERRPRKRRRTSHGSWQSRDSDSSSDAGAWDPDADENHPPPRRGRRTRQNMSGSARNRRTGRFESATKTRASNSSDSSSGGHPSDHSISGSARKMETGGFETPAEASDSESSSGDLPAQTGRSRGQVQLDAASPTATSSSSSAQPELDSAGGLGTGRRHRSSDEQQPVREPGRPKRAKAALAHLSHLSERDAQLVRRMLEEDALGLAPRTSRR